MRLLNLCQEFQDFIKIKTGKYEITNSFIIVYKGKAFEFQEFYVKEITTYCAIGAGQDFALAALYLNAEVEKAIETACELSTLCETPIKIIVVTK